MELLRVITVTLPPGLESIQRTLIIEAFVTAILLLLLVLLTLIPAVHVVLERNARNAHAKQRMYGLKVPLRKAADPECGDDDNEEKEHKTLLKSRRRTKSNQLTSMSTF